MYILNQDNFWHIRNIFSRAIIIYITMTDHKFTLQDFWQTILIFVENALAAQRLRFCARDQKVVNLNLRTAREPVLSPRAGPKIEFYFYTSFIVTIVSTSFTTPSEQAKGDNGEEKFSKKKLGKKKALAQHASQFSFDQCLESWVIFAYTMSMKFHIYD